MIFQILIYHPRFQAIEDDGNSASISIKPPTGFHTLIWNFPTIYDCRLIDVTEEK